MLPVLAWLWRLFHRCLDPEWEVERDSPLDQPL